MRDMRQKCARPGPDQRIVSFLQIVNEKGHFLKCSPLVGLKNQFLTSGEYFL